eukprot:gene24917-1623_t
MRSKTTQTTYMFDHMKGTSLSSLNHDLSRLHHTPIISVTYPTFALTPLSYPLTQPPLLLVCSGMGEWIVQSVRHWSDKPWKTRSSCQSRNRSVAWKKIRTPGIDGVTTHKMKELIDCKQNIDTPLISAPMLSVSDAQRISETCIPLVPIYATGHNAATTNSFITGRKFARDDQQAA